MQIGITYESVFLSAAVFPILSGSGDGHSNDVDWLWVRHGFDVDSVWTLLKLFRCCFGDSHCLMAPPRAGYSRNNTAPLVNNCQEDKYYFVFGIFPFPSAHSLRSSMVK